MTVSATREETVGRKKTQRSEDKRKLGTSIRVSEQFADAIHRAAWFEKMSILEYADTKLLSIIEKSYREAVIKEARRMEGGKEGK